MLKSVWSGCDIAKDKEITVAGYVNEQALCQNEKNRDRNQKIAVAELWKYTI